MRVLAQSAIVAMCSVAAAVAVQWRPAPPTPVAARVAAVDEVTGPAPALPRQHVDVTMPALTGRRINVPAGGNLQAALNDAQPGDTIVLAAGAAYRGPFRLPRKRGDGWIVITSTGAGQLPPDVRVGPAAASLMAKLHASSLHVITADPGAHHYRFVGIEVAPSDGSFLYTLIELGDDNRDPEAAPHHIIIDRCFLHGDAARGTRRGIALNSRETAVVNSYLSDFKEAGADSQAIAGWNGPGPFKIANNYLEAAGENVMFGGGDPSVPALVPSDIEIIGNHLAKPVRWKPDHPNFDGSSWAVKNLFELKNARRVRVEGNLLENNWVAAQNGFAILFTPRNQDGAAPWSVVEDVVFAGNLVRHVGAGINILGRDDNHPSQPTRRIAIHDNLFDDVGGAWGSGRLLQLLDGTRDVAVRQNTAFQTGGLIFAGDHAPHTGFVFEHNVVLHRSGVTGSGTSSGADTFARYFPAAVVRGNEIIGGTAADYPPGNRFPASVEEAGIVRTGEGAYRAVASRGGSAAPRAGADIAAIQAAMARVEHPQAAAAPTRDDFEARGASAILWTAAGLLGYVYFGYPLLIFVRARLRPRPVHKAPITPSVSILVVAHNEADRIDGRIQNLLAANYPHAQLEILIGSDGSTDGTVTRANRYRSPIVQVHAFRQRRGKAAVINDLVRHASGAILVFADARQQFDANAIKELVGSFADPSVGCVSGELVLVGEGDAGAAGRGCGFYWRYEKFIRSRESLVGSTVGATGAIYAIRRALFAPIPTDTILDDVLIPLQVVRRGYRACFEPAAKAFDGVPATPQQEYCRKVRTIGGNFQLLSREFWLLDPRRNPLWFQTVSHKALRLAIPALHGALLMANVALWATAPIYQVMLVAQIGFYAAALVGHACGKSRRRPAVLAIPYAMCLLCWATIVGFVRFVTHQQQVTWQRIDVPSVGESVIAVAPVGGAPIRAASGSPALAAARTDWLPSTWSKSSESTRL